jgi:hypothetical protein
MFKSNVECKLSKIKLGVVFRNCIAECCTSELNVIKLFTAVIYDFSH